MRLTLRTLLAYLDDVLEPAQAKEIGKKISESPVAVELVERIRDVMRRRRISAPDVTGPDSGLDANTVAEYLDNTLPEGAYADVERVCLDSDMHLAEMAACHQILTWGEPVSISSESRQRMYALGPLTPKKPNPEVPQSAEADTPKTTPHPEQATPGGNSQPAATANKAVPLSSQVPEYLRRKPLWRRALPYVVVAVVAGVWLGLILDDPSLFPTQNRRAAERPVPSPREPADVEVAAVDRNENSSTEPTVEQEPATDAVPETPAGEDQIPIEPPAPAAPAAEEPAEAPTPPAAVDVANGGENGPAIPDAEAEGAEPNVAQPPESQPEPQPVAGAAPQQPAAPAVHYNSTEGVLLRYDDRREDWVMMPRRAVVHTGERIASPEPFEAQLDVGTQLCRTTLLPHTSVRLNGATQTAPFGFQMQRGRLILEAGPAAKADDPVVVGLQVGDVTWRLELTSNETRAGVIVIPRQPEAPNQFFQNDCYQGSLLVASGSVRLVDAAGSAMVVDSMHVKPLPNAAPAGGAAADADAAQALVSLPAWLDPSPKRTTVSSRRYAHFFSQEFEVDQPISLHVPAIVKDPRPRISELAVLSLALTERPGPLVQALAQAEHEEARQAAAEGLRDWLPLSEENGKRLVEELSKYFQRDELETVDRLLWGFGEKDARNRVSSTQLVDWLEHPNVTIRELAFQHVKRLTGGLHYDYHPLLSMTQRQSSVGRWRNHLEKHDGQLVD